MLKLKYLLYSLALMFFVLACKQRAKIIKASDFSAIYAEVFVTDEWLKRDEDFRAQADTLCFYEPIFNKYSYTTEDYIATVHYYLHHPSKYAKILKKTNSMLKGNIENLLKLREKEDYLKQLLEYKDDFETTYLDFSSIFDLASLTDTISIKADNNGNYFPELVLADTLYLGPRMIVRSDSTILSNSLREIIKIIYRKPHNDNDLPLEEDNSSSFAQDERDSNLFFDEL